MWGTWEIIQQHNHINCLENAPVHEIFRPFEHGQQTVVVDIPFYFAFFPFYSVLFCHAAAVAAAAALSDLSYSIPAETEDMVFV